MAKKPMNMEESLDALGVMAPGMDGGVLQEVPSCEWEGDLPQDEAAVVEPAWVRLSPAEQYIAWVASQEWAAAYSDSVTRLLEEIQKRARALCPDQQVKE